MATSAAIPEPPARRNLLAFVSVLLSLVFPLGVVVELLAGGFSRIGAALVLAGLPATALAIVAGHVALRRSDREPFQQPLRGVARIGLLLGYGTYLGLAGLVIWVIVHGIPRMHIVY
ncbi:MAG: hypothetical protein ACXVDA_24525 [Ktedonobacterales bacterium]